MTRATMARVVSVNVGLPRDVPHPGGTLRTGIFKRPVAGRVRVLEQGLEGDGQADLENHGGPSKAVYAYPQEHYAPWAEALGRPELETGQLGENLTLTGILEGDAGIGDVLRIGTARFRIAQPRKPCMKLGVRMGDPTFPRRFLKSGWLGFYLSVLDEGDVGAGDPITVEDRGSFGLTITDVWRVVFVDKDDREGAERVLAVPWLSPEFVKPLQRRLGRDET